MALLPAHAIVQTFWPTAFYAFRWRDHPGEAPGIISYLYALRDEQKTNIASGVAPSAKSSAGLYESDFDLLDRRHDGLQKLRAFIVESVKQAVLHVNQAKLSPSNLDVEIRDSWFHITNDGGFHDAHYHGGCSWCGIYYLQIGDSGQRQGSGPPNGGNRFYCPHWIGGRHEDFGNRYLNQTYLDPPISDAMLLLFPSYLMHSGLSYRGEKDRIIISVNTRTLLGSKQALPS